MWFDLRAVGPDYGDVAPKSFVYEVELAAPPEKVFAILADPAQWPKWFPDMRGMRWLSPEGERGKVGARREADTKSSKVEEHYVVWETNRRMAFYAERMTIPLVVEFMEDYHLEPLGSGRTKLKWFVHYRPRASLGFLHPVVRPVFDRMFKKGSEALVAYVARQ